jgi:hypothetical protein
MNLLRFSNSYYLSQLEINHVIQEPKSRGHVDHLRLDNAIAFGVAFHQYVVCVAMYTTQPAPLALFVANLHIDQDFVPFNGSNTD